MRFDFSLVIDAMLLQILQQSWIGEGNHCELALNFLAAGLFRLCQFFFKIYVPGGLFLLRCEAGFRGCDAFFNIVSFCFSGGLCRSL
jgi:hypothetical protein